MSPIISQELSIEPRVLPRIGIPVPTFADQSYNNHCWPQYAAAVRTAGGEAVRLDLGLSTRELNELAVTCAAFLLPGSPADVDSSLYGQVQQAGTALMDSVREGCDRLLLEHAEATGKPILGICFGAQFLNVWRGGTLIQDLLPMPVNHSAGATVAVAHSVLVRQQSFLGGLLTLTEALQHESFRRLPVNSSHHQAVATPGDGLRVVARSAEDGVIEAFEGNIGFAVMLGVQWHPERSVEMSAASRALFLWLVSAATDATQIEGQPHA